MTCKDCEKYEECRKNKKIKMEIYSNGWLKEPRLCNYVELICSDYILKRGVDNGK